ncbi:hypothetical protein GCM10007981_01580 [Thermocladium modestius]|uniref:Uncharacterized protein n=1 Tax=Thermocladium modestius TaxID=62609 RepID=A0A830GTK8_9CREN|nr:hypothetical protein [Thermocladium modestius]GGP19133.1 hypothetical protein GCM10007981_01580 [Thermocladium modestius]
MSLLAFMPEIIAALAVALAAVLVILLLRQRGQRQAPKQQSKAQTPQQSKANQQRSPQSPPPSPSSTPPPKQGLQAARPAGDVRPIPPPPPPPPPDSLGRLESQVSELWSALKELSEKLEEVREEVRGMSKSHIEYAYAQVGYIPSSLDELRELLSLDGIAIVAGGSVVESSGSVDSGSAGLLDQLGASVLMRVRNGVYEYLIKLKDERILVISSSKYYDENSINLLKTIVEQYGEYSSR